MPISDFSMVTAEVRNQSIQFVIHEFEMLYLVNSPNVCKVIDSGIDVVEVGQKTTELPWLATDHKR